MSDPDADLRLQLTRQVSHWHAAARALDDLESFASAPAWASLERYLGFALRSYLGGLAGQLEREAAQLQAELRAAADAAQLERVQRRLVDFRRRFLATEAAFDFYGDAVNTRTSGRIAALLCACDVLAVRSMEQLLGPLGVKTPRVVSHLQHGRGAAILPAGRRLWDGRSISPVAAIKVTRHNLHRPTAITHEAGHQIADMLCWVAELAAALRVAAAGASEEVADAWASWASEVAADAFGFAHTGYASVAGLHDVVADDEASVFRHRLGDPHPISYLRVLLGVAMCRRAYGPGPWDALERAWRQAYPLDRAPAHTRPLIERSLPCLDAIAEACVWQPMRAFGGRPLAASVNPERVSPDALAALERSAGAALETSPYWLWQDCVRLLALGGLRAALAAQPIAELVRRQEAWMVRLGEGSAVAAA
jgi:hypothetical protein